MHPAKILLAAMLLSPTLAHAAGIERVDRESCGFSLTGEIAAGDLERLKASGIDSGDSLCLDSLGGSYSSALDVADYLLGRNIETVLDKDALCMSSCAVIFMAGSEWEEIFLPKRSMHATALLGFHAPYLLPDDKVYTPADLGIAYAAGLRSVARMMTLGADGEAETEGFIPNRVIIELLKKGPDEVYLIDNAMKADELGIDLFGIRRAEWSAREACNACMIRNRGHHTDDACDRPDEAYTASLGKNSVAYVFEGFGGEGAYLCVVDVIRGAQGRLDAAIQATVTEDEFPLNPDLFLPLSDQDALDPNWVFSDR